MSSINTGAININYPQPGINQNSQGFRDNFSSIKNNLDIASSEITELQNKSILKSGLSGSTLDNNMNNTLISNALTSGFRTTTYNLGNNLSGSVNVDIKNGDVQFGTITGNVSLGFLNWPPIGTNYELMLILSVNSTALNSSITFPSNVTLNSLATIENSSARTITFPAGVTTLGFSLVTRDCGVTIDIIPINRSRRATQITNNIPATLVGAQGDKPGTIAADTNFLYVCTANFDGSTQIWKRVNLSFGGSALINARDVAYDASSSGSIQRSVETKLRDFVSADDFGAVGNGITNDSNAIQNALNSKKYVLLTPGKTYLANNLEAPANGALICLGGRATIRVPTGAGLYGMIIRQSNFIIDGINFDGGNLGPYNISTPSSGLRVGLSIGNTFGTGLQLQNITVQNCDMYGFDYAGLYGGEVQIGFVFGKRVTLHNVNCYRNYVNIWCTPRFEYVNATLCYGYEGFAGVIVAGGNNKFASCSFENNYQNCQLASGENNSHGGFVGCSFNHNAPGGLGLYALDIDFGMAFTGCFFWYSDIALNNTKGVQIRNSEIVLSNITITGGGVNSIDDNWFRDPITPTLIGNTFTTFRRNRTNSTNTSFVPVYGDVYAQATATNYGSLPRLFGSAGAEVSLKCVYGIKKWHGVDAAWMQSGDSLYIGATAMYQIDASLTLDIGVSAELVTLAVARKNNAGTIVERFPNSGVFNANTAKAVVAVSTRMLCQSGDTIDILVTTSSGVNSIIPVGGINVKVSSVD